MYAEIKAAIESVKVISDILESSRDLRNFNEMASALSKVNAQLLSATAVALESQEKQANLANRIRELESKLQSIENWESQKQRYELHRFQTGTFSYVLKPNVEGNEPLHHLCESCMNKNQKSILQAKGEHSLKCNNCKSEITIKEFRQPDFD